MKKYALIALLLSLALALTACGGASRFQDVNTDELLTLADYKALPYQEVSTVPTEYALTVALQNAMSESGYGEESTDEITEGTVEIGDTVYIDYRGLKDGVAFEGGTAEGQSLTIGSGQFIPGFEEGLVGAKIGTTVELPLTFPADYSSAELAGQDVIFEVTILSVTSRMSYPELTDEIANKIDENVKTADELLKAQKEEVETANIEEATSDKKNTLWSTVITNTTFNGDLPEKLLEKAAEEYEAYYKAIATQNAYDTVEELLTASGITTEQYETAKSSYSESQVRSQLVAYAIAKAEGYTVTDAIFDEKAAEYAAAASYEDVDKYISLVTEDVVHDQIILDFAVNFVMENASVTPAK